MKHRVTSFISALALTTAIGCGSAEDYIEDVTLRLASSDEIKNYKAVENSYIVAFRPQESRLNFTDYFSEYKHYYSMISDSFISDPRIKDINFITSLDLNTGKSTQSQFSKPTNLMWTGGKEAKTAALAKVEFKDAKAARELLTEWQETKTTWYAEPDYINELKTTFTQWAQDTTSMAQWWQGADMLNLSAAFSDIASGNVPNGSSEAEVLANHPVIAVLDSGVDVEHTALKSNIFVNSAPGRAGCTGDVYGCDTTTADKGVLGNGNIFPFGTTGHGQPCPDSPALQRVCPHGTHVSGIIAATPDATNAVAGVCPVCKILVVKIIKNIGGEGRAPDSAILNGLKYLAQFRKNNSAAIRVVNSSFGKYARSRSVGLVVSLLKNHANGVLVIGAASNEDSMSRTYPAAFKEAIAVAAVDNYGRKASYSNFGPWVDVAAPGGGREMNSTIWSTAPGSQYTGKSGTSMACPVVAGLAGLLLAVEPNKSYASLKNAIINGANPALYKSDFAGGFNYNNYYPQISGESVRTPLLGSGVVNAQASIQGTKSSAINASQLHRVVGGCGIVGAKHQNSPWMIITLLLLPLMLCFVRVNTRHP